MSRSRPFILFTDACPLHKGGSGCHVLARKLLEELPGQFGLVVTRRSQAWVRRADIYRVPGVRTVIFPDAPAFRPRRLRPWIDLLLFVLSLPYVAWTARRSGCGRIFALFGADSWFLPKADLLRRATGLPLDIYLVDDLEDSARLAGRPVTAWLVGHVEPRVLRRAARVFGISPGYTEHLWQKYGQRATWLPVLAAEPATRPSPYQVESAADDRSIIFFGSLNALYADGLRDLYTAIKVWNETPGRPYKLRLTLLVLADPAAWIATLPDRNHLEVVIGLTPAALAERARTAWATFLPYSFDPALRVMVSTSFPTKFTECVAGGRPILVYGPAYASIPRYFREAGLPLCVTDPDGLRHGLEEIATCDGPDLNARYGELLRTFHTPENLRAILEEST